MPCHHHLVWPQLDKLSAALRLPESRFFMRCPPQGSSTLDFLASFFGFNPGVIYMSLFLQNPQVVSERWAGSLIDSESRSCLALRISQGPFLALTDLVNSVLGDAVLE